MTFRLVPSFFIPKNCIIFPCSLRYFVTLLRFPSPPVQISHVRLETPWKGDNVHESTVANKASDFHFRIFPDFEMSEIARFFEWQGSKTWPNQTNSLRWEKTGKREGKLRTFFNNSLLTRFHI